jgi:DNA-binding transcriptional ArsR family regulator
MLSLSALADPTRRRIVEILARGALASGDIAEQFSISAPAVSQHLKVLKDARLVQVRIDAQRRIYHIDPAGFADLKSWLRNMEGFWAVKLDNLDRALRKPQPGRKREGRT